MPESDLHRAEDLIDQYIAQLQCARRESSNRYGERAYSTRGSQEERRYVALKKVKAKHSGSIPRNRTLVPGR